MKSYGLIFDVDGVIADTESVSATITSQILAELFDIQGVTYSDFDAGRGRGAEAYLKAAGIAHGVDLTLEQVMQAEAIREERFLSHLQSHPLPAYQGVLDLINEGLSNEDFNLAIATSSTREKSRAVLTSAGVPYHKMGYVSGSDVTNKKPDPELFLTAASQIEISPEKCLVIEDAPSGISAAVSAGCKCVAVTNSFQRDKLSVAHLIIDSLTELSMADVLDLINK